MNYVFWKLLRTFNIENMLRDLTPSYAKPHLHAQKKKKKSARYLKFLGTVLPIYTTRMITFRYCESCQFYIGTPYIKNKKKSTKAKKQKWLFATQRWPKWLFRVDKKEAYGWDRAIRPNRVMALHRLKHTWKRDFTKFLVCSVNTYSEWMIIYRRDTQKKCLRVCLTALMVWFATHRHHPVFHPNLMVAREWHGKETTKLSAEGFPVWCRLFTQMCWLCFAQNSSRYWRSISSGSYWDSEKKIVWMTV